MLRLVAVVAVLLVVATAWANESIAPGSPLALLSKPKVQEELKLSAEQIAAVKQLYEAASRDDKPISLENLKKQMKPEQLTRLRQLVVQVRGGAALADPEVVKELQLSLTQQRKIAEVWKNHEEDLRQILQVTRFRSPEAMRKFILEHRRGAGKEMLKFLTEEQTAAFKKLQGDPIDLKGLED